MKELRREVCDLIKRVRTHSTSNVIVNIVKRGKLDISRFVFSWDRDGTLTVHTARVVDWAGERHILRADWDNNFTQRDLKELWSNSSHAFKIRSRAM